MDLEVPYFVCYSQTVEQMDLFGNMSTPPDIHSPTVMTLQYTFCSGSAVDMF